MWHRSARLALTNTRTNTRCLSSRYYSSTAFCPSLSNSTAMREVATAAQAEASTSSSSGYNTLSQPVQYEEEVKKSRFLVKAWPVESSAKAQQLIKDASDPSASHNCFAWKIGQEYRSSDDGEPSGTAGRPILSSIEGEGLDGVCVLVTRYFGGTKLGTGGLVRAYGGAARNCLKAAPKHFVKYKVQLTVVVPYTFMGAAYGILDRKGCERLSEEYLEDGSVELVCQTEQDSFEDVRDSIVNASKGQGVVKLKEREESG